MLFKTINVLAAILFITRQRVRMNLVFSNREFVQLLKSLSVKKFSDTILGFAFLRSNIFRRVSSFYFLTIAWATVYVVFKWANRAPIIAGKKRKKRFSDQLDFKRFEDDQLDRKQIESYLKRIESQLDLKQAEDLFQQTYNVIVARIESKETKFDENKTYLQSLSRYFKQLELNVVNYEKILCLIHLK